jgi:pyridoxine 4-dehydrogenase
LLAARQREKRDLSLFKIFACEAPQQTTKATFMTMLVLPAVLLVLPLLTQSLQLPLAQRIGTVRAGPIEVSSLGCGTWSWGNRLLWNYDTANDEEIFCTYRILRDAGVSIFDTADSYGTFDLNGRAEILLGQFERRYLTEKESDESNQPFWSRSPPPRPQQVATKLAPYPWRLTRGSVLQAARDSLKRLEQDKLAIAQLHWSTSKYLPQQEGALWEGLADIYDEGLCEAVGVSNYGPRQLQKVASRMEERGVPLAVAQIQYSLMVYKECIEMNDVCEQVGCRLISYSPLCLGLLTGKYTLDNLPPPGNPRRQLFRELLPGAQDLLATLTALAKEYGKTQSQIAINWALCKGTVPIPGARTVRMAQENLGAQGWRLRPDAVEELDRVASNIAKPMIQNIFQTK